MINLKVVYFQGRLHSYRILHNSGLIKSRPLVDKEGSSQKSFYGNSILAGQDGNDYCKRLLMEDKPCMLGRIGTVEMGVINAYLKKEAKLIKRVLGERTQLYVTMRDFFPNEENEICKFVQLYIESASYLDAFGVFNNHAEDLFQRLYAPNAQMMQFTTFEPFYFIHPWSYALKGKKVLVIHPFEKSIKEQYSKRKLLFDDPEVLPEFDLVTIKAIQTIGNNTAGFCTWFEALEYQKKQIDSTDFDIALIGCGAYAFPLGAYVKSKGKKCVITAGATQLLFGIKGARWDHAETPVPYNDSWIRPNNDEKPVMAETVENGCYW